MVKKTPQEIHEDYVSMLVKDFEYWRNRSSDYERALTKAIQLIRVYHRKTGEEEKWETTPEGSQIVAIERTYHLD